MFNLEQSISAWRKQLLADGIKAPVPLDELEAHLRDDIEQQIKSGLTEPEAFSIALRHIGQADVLRAEFKKTKPITERQLMIRIITTIAGLFGTVLGLGMILPALGNHARHPEAWTDRQMNPLILGIVMLVIGASAAFYCIHTRREGRGRIFITIGLLLASAFYCIAAIIALLHAREMTPAGWMILAVAVAASAAYFGSCFRSNHRLARLNV